MIVRAPFDGIVTNVSSLQVGAYLQASQSGFSLVSTTHMWIAASPKETELTYVREGQPVAISVDTYPGVEWKGKVSSISPASGSSFSLLPAQKTTGNWVKVVQRIPMLVSIDDMADKPPLRIGMSVTVGVDTGHAVAVPGAAPVIANRGAITACVILAVIMQALDTTIANVALPYIQGSVSASADQINWVLTSYIVAAAIMTPPSGFLAARFGRKNVLLTAIVGFVVASVLCGLAAIAAADRHLPSDAGSVGASLVPLSQGILLDIYAVEERGKAMALFGVSVMVGPVLGPVIGGWLTDNISWRWVFYINVPIGMLAFFGIVAFVSETTRQVSAKLDWFGFGMLSLAIATLQLFLDRGEQLDWFSSTEIQIEALICASSVSYLSIRSLRRIRSSIRRLFLDRNFSVSMFFIFVIGVTYLASLALMTPYLQTLTDYSVITAGIVMGPRGIGTMASMFFVGRMIGKIDTRALLIFGFSLTAWAMYDMTGWMPDVSQWTICLMSASSRVQG